MAEPQFRFVGLDVGEGETAVVRFQILDETGEQIGVYPVGIKQSRSVGGTIAEAHRKMCEIVQAWRDHLYNTAATYDQR